MIAISPPLAAGIYDTVDHRDDPNPRERVAVIAMYDRDDDGPVFLIIHNDGAPEWWAGVNTPRQRLRFAVAPSVKEVAPPTILRYATERHA
jgi:hypothetical protein